MSLKSPDSIGESFAELSLAPFVAWGNTMRYFTGMFPTSGDQFDHGNNADTVLLIPGFTQGGSSMITLGKKLSEKHNVAYIDSLPWYSADVKWLVETIHDKYQALLEQHKNQNISIIGHSFGGVLAVLLLSEHLEARVRQIITVGSPHEGIAHHSFSSMIPAIHELEEGVYKGRSIIQSKQLESITTIAAGSDFVIPTESQHGEHLPLSADVPKYHDVWDDYGHFSFLDSKGADQVAALLH